MPDGLPIDFDAFDHSDNKVDFAYWDAMFEAMDAAQAKIRRWGAVVALCAADGPGRGPHACASRPAPTVIAGRIDTHLNLVVPSANACESVWLEQRSRLRVLEQG